MRARGRGRGRGRGGGRGRGRMRGQGTRGTRRGGKTARSVQGNPVDDKWKWLSTYANDSSISSPPVFNVESGPSAEAKLKKVQDGASLHSDWSCDCKSHGARPHSYRPNLGLLEGKTLCVLPREAG